MKDKTKIIKYIVAGIYAAFMLFLLFGRPPRLLTSLSYWEQLKYSVNLVPFSTVSEYLGYLFDGGYMVRQAIINLGGNVIMFIPLGIFLPLLWEKTRRFLPHVLTTAGIITTVELIQLFTLRGTLDIDDLILNIIGSAVGFAVYHATGRIYN
jgi:glycopeptide antibiotics resistance protein